MDAAVSPGFASGTGLIALDVDGTLVGADHCVASRTRRAIGAAVDAGVFVVIATARGPAQLRPIVEQVPQLASGYAVMFQGALVTSVDGSDVLIDAPLDAATAELAAACCRSFGATVNWFSGEYWYAERRDELVIAEEQTVGSSSTAGVPLGLSPHKLLAVVAPEHAAVLSAVQRELPAGVHAVRSHPNYLEITSHIAEKGSAVQRLATMLGIVHEHTASVGDGENDISMFTVTANSFAMGHAADPVRAAARSVVPTNEENGCAIAIEAFVEHLCGGR